MKHFRKKERFVCRLGISRFRIPSSFNLQTASIEAALKIHVAIIDTLYYVCTQTIEPRLTVDVVYRISGLTSGENKMEAGSEYGYEIFIVIYHI